MARSPGALLLNEDLRTVGLLPDIEISVFYMKGHETSFVYSYNRLCIGYFDPRQFHVYPPLDILLNIIGIVPDIYCGLHTFKLLFFKASRFPAARCIFLFLIRPQVA